MPNGTPERVTHESPQETLDGRAMPRRPSVSAFRLLAPAAPLTASGKVVAGPTAGGAA